MEPLVTIIIPTFNRGEKILNVLRSLENQSFKNFEILIINDGSTDNTKDVLDTQLSTFNLNINVIHQNNAGRANVRNTGAFKAKDGLLIFMDDDMRHDKFAIERHILHHRQFPYSILVGNQIEDPHLAKTDIQKYRAAISRIWSSNLAKLKGPLTVDNLHITAANFSILKSHFFLPKGFDSRLTDAEDYDLAMRAFKLNIPIYYNQDVIGWHDDFITCASYTKRQRQYLLAHSKLKKLKPQLYNQFSRNPQVLNNYKKYIYKVLKGSFWVNLVDQGFFVFLPIGLRYRLYSAIIYANSGVV